MLTVSTGPIVQYFIGTFDGHTFKNENPKETVLWMDYGPDSYAGVTFNSAPDSRRIAISWMNRWEYADTLSFNEWNGQTSIPRDLRLVYSETEKRLLLSTTPVPEIESLRTNTFHQKEVVLKPDRKVRINDLTRIESKLLDIRLKVDVSRFPQKSRFGLEFRGVNDKLIVYFDGSFGIDRRNAGRHDFSPKFANIYTAPRLTSPAATPLMDIRLILDVSSVELFADNGRTVMTSLFFTDNNLTSDLNLFFESLDKNFELKTTDLYVSQLKSIWS